MFKQIVYSLLYPTWMSLTYLSLYMMMHGLICKKYIAVSVVKTSIVRRGGGEAPFLFMNVFLQDLPYIIREKILQFPIAN